MSHFSSHQAKLLTVPGYAALSSFARQFSHPPNQGLKIGLARVFWDTKIEGAICFYTDPGEGYTPVFVGQTRFILEDEPFSEEVYKLADCWIEI